MTRDEFIDSIDDWSDLIDFCNEYNLSFCDDVYSEDDRDEEINDNLSDMADNANSWQDFLSELRSIPTGYDYYSKDNYGEWAGLDDYGDLYERVDRVAEWGAENGIFEDDEEEEYIEEEETNDECDTGDDFVSPEEPMSIGELIDICHGQLTNIRKASDKAKEQEAIEFQMFVAGCVTIKEGE